MSTPRRPIKTPHPRVSTDSVRTYLQEVGQFHLLSAEQEILYAKQVQQMMALLEAKTEFSRAIGREPTTGEWALQVELAESDFNFIEKPGSVETPCFQAGEETDSGFSMKEIQVEPDHPLDRYLDWLQAGIDSVAVQGSTRKQPPLCPARKA